MRVRDADAAGFSIIEVIIAMVLLGIIAVALLPVLWQGIALSSRQSSTATATRHLNAVVESARPDATCSSLLSLSASPPVIEDGGGNDVTITALLTDSAGVTITPARCAGSTPPHNQTLKLKLTLSGTGGAVLASTTALIFVQ